MLQYCQKLFLDPQEPIEFLIQPSLKVMKMGTMTKHCNIFAFAQCLKLNCRKFQIFIFEYYLYNKKIFSSFKLLVVILNFLNKLIGIPYNSLSGSIGIILIIEIDSMLCSNEINVSQFFLVYMLHLLVLSCPSVSQIMYTYRLMF